MERMKMNQITRISELSGEHVGQNVRLQNPEGGYIEGTLARISATISAPYGSSVVYEVEFDEFQTGWNSKDRIKFWVNGVGIAKVLHE